MNIRTLSLAVAALSVAAAGPAFAHITLLTKSTPVGSTYMAVFRVPHGCDGAATTAVRIQIPTGVYGVKPEPKPGWKVTVTNGKFEVPFTNKGTQLTSGVTEIDFTGGNLPDADYDEFTLYTTLADSVCGGNDRLLPDGAGSARAAPPIRHGSRSPPPARPQPTTRTRLPR